MKYFVVFNHIVLLFLYKVPGVYFGRNTHLELLVLQRANREVCTRCRYQNPLTNTHSWKKSACSGAFEKANFPSLALPFLGADYA